MIFGWEGQGVKGKREERLVKFQLQQVTCLPRADQEDVSSTAYHAQPGTSFTIYYLIFSKTQNPQHGFACATLV